MRPLSKQCTPPVCLQDLETFRDLLSLPGLQLGGAPRPTNMKICHSIQRKTVTIIVGSPCLRKSEPWIFCSSVSACRFDTAMLTRLAEDPMIDPIPPIHAPTLSGQARTPGSSPGVSFCFMSSNTYTMVVVKGRDSRKALPKEQTHKSIMIANNVLESSGNSMIKAAMVSPSNLITPNSDKDYTRTKRQAKKNNVSHSTAIK